MLVETMPGDQGISKLDEGITAIMEIIIRGTTTMAGTITIHVATVEAVVLKEEVSSKELHISDVHHMLTNLHLLSHFLIHFTNYQRIIM